MRLRRGKRNISLLITTDTYRKYLLHVGFFDHVAIHIPLYIEQIVPTRTVTWLLLLASWHVSQLSANLLSKRASYRRSLCKAVVPC